jgi:parallel beta-helix repeat protein
MNNYAANFGAVYCNNNSSPLIISNTIMDNSSSSGGGGICCRGGSSPTIVNNTISGNRAGYGAGICVWSSSPTIKGNIISNNFVARETGHSGGGIALISFCSAVIQNNVITGNIAGEGGGISAHNSSGPIITNNTITGNTANLGGGISSKGSSLTVLNSILWNDSPDEIYLDESSTISITYSDIQGGWIGTGNIHADPLFVDAANANYHLQASSPCINAGDNSAIPQSLVVDIDGNPRIINGIVDLGAYESSMAPPLPTLPEALDTDLSITTGDGMNWFGQTTTSYYDGDAAQSGDISHDQESWIQTTVSGTGTVKFYWKVSSEEDDDFLEFYIDGSLQDRISGSVNWQQKTYAISTLGSHTLGWRYVKDMSTDSGNDCGWIDRLEWVPTPGPAPLLLAFNPDPADGATDVMQTPTLRWTAGERALQHDVYFGNDEEAVGNADIRSPEYKVTKDLGSESYEPEKLEWNTTYYWRVDEYNIDETISEGKVWSFRVMVLVDPLAEALDTDLSFTTGGNADWFSQAATRYHDGDAARSGEIKHDQESWMQTTVSGAGTISFYWKVSSEEYFDFLEFYIDGLSLDRISGSVDWQQMTYEITYSDLHILEWRYTKDVGTDSGSDCGWVDKVEWSTTP